MRTASSLSSWGTRAQTLACILGARSGPLVDAGYRVGGIGDGDRARRGGTAEQAGELWPPLYCGAAMPAYGCCANTLHPLVLGPAPPFARRPPRAQHIRGLAVDAVRGVYAQGALRHLVHSRRAHPGVELGHRGVSASLSIAIFPPGNRPPVTVMMAAFAPPT